MGRQAKYDWHGVILPAAAAYVEASTAGVTLRRLHYYLASRRIGGYTNTHQDYSSLSAKTAEARDAGTFPDLVDNVRWIDQYPYQFARTSQAREWMVAAYQRDRTEFSDVSIYVGVEKAGLVPLLRSWFRPLGLPILPLGGWASQTFRESVRRDIVRRNRPAVLIYAGDFDPSGIYIGEQFAAKVGAFDHVVRVGLNVDQLDGLLNNPYPDSKKRNGLIPRFVAEYGPRLVARGYEPLVQFEIDALEDAPLRALYRDAIRPYFDASAFMRARQREREDRAEIARKWA